MIEWRRRFLLEFLAATRFTIRILISETAGDRKPASKWYGHFAPSGSLTPYHRARSFLLNADSNSVHRLQGDERSGLLCADAGQDQIKSTRRIAPRLFCRRGRRPNDVRRALHEISRSQLQRTCRSDTKRRIGRGDS